MEPILKIWYDGLEEGKIQGLKCKECGKVMFPPMPVCEDCSGTDMEWVEMSGKGELFSVGFSPSGIPGYTDDPIVMGYMTTEEGNLFASQIEGAKKKMIPALTEQLPCPVTLGIKKMNEKISFPTIQLEAKED